MKSFRDRIAVITGGASGIGRATAGRLAAEGMRVVLADVEDGALEEACAEMEENGAEVMGVTCDVAEAEQVDELAKRAVDRFGAVHVVFNNAGVAVTGAAWEHTLADWQWVLGVNLWGVVHGIRSFVPLMLEQGDEGHVVSTASMAGVTSNPGMAIYNVTKHSVVTLSETLLHDLRAQGSKIGVSVLCPGYIQTRIMDSERNRPGDPAQDPPRAEATTLAVTIEHALREGVSGGFAPTVVADAVLEGIRDEKFWLLVAQPEIKDAMRARCEELMAERNPTTPEAVLSLG